MRASAAWSAGRLPWMSVITATAPSGMADSVAAHEPEHEAYPGASRKVGAPGQRFHRVIVSIDIHQFNRYI